ncbi:polysaccharide pyruvyl transferase CsaB [Cytobacillus depressus]|uniref:Polysaccharide pyruvyl transferase CsaB n=1 Tax=Cytobacillus depressus TaxID=1602942 RepID=A0A6L3V6H9_9BACI|nr:polysaccharide pyruvyl transferase CsaB [Cytobacillus depressus]KAB2336748.1 polysaccharide pyruvyl transferase CsaB [Cytobacillus depressus]
MRIVMSGYYGFDNVGDEAILFSIIQALKAAEPGVEITVLSNNPEQTKATYGVQAVNRWKLGEVLAALKNSDGLISGGGSLLQDETGFKSIPYYTGIMKLAQMVGKKVFIYAQGMGPIHKSYNKKIVKHVLKKTQITIRDEASKKLLEEIGLKNSMDIVPDPVLGLRISSRANKWWEEQNFQGRVLTVSVRDWPSSVDFKKKIAETLDRAIEDGMDVVFVPMHGEHDDKTSGEVASLMSGKAYISPFDHSIEEKIAIIGQSNLLVGMRLHALIFSSIMHTPFVALSYDPKIDAFADICSQQVAGHVNEDTWNAAFLYDCIQQVLRDEPLAVEKLKEKVEPLQRSAMETAERSIEYFRS